MSGKTNGAKHDKTWFDESAVIEADQLASPVLQRLIEEVRNEKLPQSQLYNRIHNRHNRGGGGGW